MSKLGRELAEAGGVDAPRERSARLGELLSEALAHGARELGRSRSGYADPVAVVFVPAERAALAICPVAPELRADPAAVGQRAGMVVAATVAALVEATAPERPHDAGDLNLRLGSFGDWLGLVYPASDGREAAELAHLALDEQLAGVDRLRCESHVLPGHVVDGITDLREPIGRTHPLRVAEAVARLGGSAIDELSIEELEPALLSLLEPPRTLAPRAHDDPDPARRIARRILQRLDGMGKWGGYHTEFRHLARGFEGNERARALAVGEGLVAAGLLGEKTSVGQRHVFLNPRRVADIRGLIDEGRVPAGLTLP